MITCGANLIGSAVIHFVIEGIDHLGLKLDELSHKDNKEFLGDFWGLFRYQFAQSDVYDRGSVAKLLEGYKLELVAF